MVPKLSKIVSILQFFADVNKKSKVVIAIYLYASESYRFKSRKSYWLLCYDLEFKRY